MLGFLLAEKKFIFPVDIEAKNMDSDNEMAPAIKKRIRQALLDAGLNGRTLAVRTGYTYGTVRNILCGTNKSATERQKVEDALGVAIWSDPEKYAGRHSKS
jgi:hypothetical protein